MKAEFLDYICHKNKALKSIKKPIMGWVCTYTPIEIIIAAGFYPYRILPTTDPSLANSYLDSNFCPYVRSCLGEALGKRPEYVDNLIIVNSCDAMRRLYDAWRHYVQGTFIYLLDLPRDDSAKTIQYYQDNLRLLINRLEEKFKIKISEDSLYQAISVCNKTRELLAELSDLYINEQVSLSAVEFLQIVKGSMVFPQEEYNGLLEKFIKDEKKEENILSNRSGIRNKSKILITGTIMDDLSIAEVIEDYGGKIVFVDMCTGNRYFQNQIPLKTSKKINDNPLKLLAEYYLSKTPCPRMMNLEKRWEYLLKIIKDNQVKGVIFYNLKFCDTSFFELPIIRERLQKYGISSLCLEGEFASSTSGRIKTRIQAFLEVLEFAG
ncbi:2-hydroxyacyl-CoA dehydratase family protein [bacterium]|nr:2-hydroxyacyl-CoA dehydratase family protein [bacterium]MBU4510076.1 2-hydroxyacyl-CoA dehydratase family protein [bacterium]